MIEESTMEKKSAGRGAPASAKFATDSKLKQEVSNGNGKPSRSGANWKRDGYFYPKSDTFRKPVAQKNKAFCKKPKPRGFTNDYDWNKVVNVEEAEIGSAVRPGSKKLNLNHLLNFTYVPRECPRSNWLGKVNYSSKKHKYNKEQYLQANCQFVVSDLGNYSVYNGDPDLLVDWDSIEQIRLVSHEVPSCPICLFPPVAAKMTRCGHIYCWPCILHYLALTDKTWRKCPICFEAIHKSDLKSVISVPLHPYAVGEKINMVLMRRERGSMIVTPKSNWDVERKEMFNIDDHDTHFSKLILASKKQVLDCILKKEEIELETALEAEKDCPEVCFIESAVNQLRERQILLCSSDGSSANDDVPVEQLKEQGRSHLISESESIDASISCDGDDDISYTFSRTHLSSGCEDTSETDFESEDKKENDIKSGCEEKMDSFDTSGNEMAIALEKSYTPRHTSACNQRKDVYYFYQAADGQHIYLYNMNIRMLVQEYGSLELCPESITADIVGKETFYMTEEFRKQRRYLGYLPLTAEFELVELHFEKPLISEGVLDSFFEEIEKRKHNRSRRDKEERRREKKIQWEEKQKQKQYPGTQICLDSHKQFPLCRDIDGASSKLDSVALSSSPEITDILNPSSSNGDFDIISKDANGMSGTPSFAQMLRDGKFKPKPVSGKERSLQPGVNKWTKNSADSGSDAEDYFPVPEYHQSFGEAIQAAIDKATTSNADAGQSSPSRRSKKKNKQQQRLLFTNSVVRGN